MAARQSFLQRVLSSLGVGQSSDMQVQPATDNTTDNTANIVSRAERNRIISRVVIAANPVSTSPEAVHRYVKELSNRIATTRKDNVEILKLAPEIDQSAAIIIPSIMSPNDLRDADVQFECPCSDLDATQQGIVVKVITDYFNKHLNISTKIPEWIKEALYISGAKPLMTIPVSELDDMINNPKNFLSSGTETLEASIERWNEQSIFGMNDNATSYERTIKEFTDVTGALETFHSDLVSGVLPVLETEELRKAFSDKASSYDRLNDSFETGIKLAAKSFLSPALLAVTDNPDVLKGGAVQRKIIDSMDDVLKKRYKIASYISIPDSPSPPPSGNKITGHPLFMELPTGSVVPIFIPGTPSEHIGYFVLIDEFGNPVHIVDTTEHNFKLNNTEQRSTFDNLFKAFGFEDLKVYGTAQSRLMTDIYQQIVDTHLKTKLKDTGLSNVSIGMDNSIYKCMFARYLAKRKTRILFVPKSFLTYCCFEYNENGTGRSKLEDIKFILSLRITVIVCRMLSTMNNAVDRRRLNITLNNNIGNPFEYIETVKREAINKALVSFSYNPDEITRSLAQRALTVSAKGLPGAAEFDITNEPNERTSASFDPSFDDDLKNLMILQLKVPPSALNSLSEDEYSRSIATTNLFFSRYIMGEQKKTIKFVSEFVQQYIRLSKPLQNLIMSELRGKDKKAGNEDKPVETESGTVDVYFDIESIIQHVKLMLPPPNIAPDKTQFEELNTVIEAFKGVVDAIYDEDLFADDPDLQKVISMLRASIKSDLIKDHIHKLGMGSSVLIPDIADLLPTELLEIHQQITNFRAAVEQQKRFLTPETVPPADDTGGGFDGGFGGGGGGFDETPPSDQPADNTPF